MSATNTLDSTFGRIALAKKPGSPGKAVADALTRLGACCNAGCGNSYAWQFDGLHRGESRDRHRGFARWSAPRLGRGASRRLAGRRFQTH